MIVVVEGEQSEKVTVNSGVPDHGQMGAIFSKTVYKWLPSVQIYQNSKRSRNSLRRPQQPRGVNKRLIREYISMPNKSILSIKNKSQTFYSLNVQNNAYLGLHISEDLKKSLNIPKG
jgi:hypothetical protein